jgi:hypothetical protein
MGVTDRQQHAVQHLVPQLLLLRLINLNERTVDQHFDVRRDM